MLDYVRSSTLPAPALLNVGIEEIEGFNSSTNATMTLKVRIVHLYLPLHDPLRDHADEPISCIHTTTTLAVRHDLVKQLGHSKHYDAGGYGTGWLWTTWAMVAVICDHASILVKYFI
jgi:hypothetical protein